MVLRSRPCLSTRRPSARVRAALLGSLGLLLLPVPGGAVPVAYDPGLAGCAGEFSDTDCWVGGAVPGAGDDAVFDTGAAPGSPYTVDFTANAASDNAQVDNDSLQWDLGGNAYTLTTNLEIGLAGGDVGALQVSSGQLSGFIGRVGQAGIGELTVGAGGALDFETIQVWSGSTLAVDGGTVDLSSVLNLYDGSTYTQTAGLVSTTALGSNFNLILDSFELGGGTLDISGSQARFWFGSDNNQTGGTFSNTAGDWSVGTFLGGDSFNLSGGLMEINSLTVGSGASDNIFNLSGGTLDVNALNVSGAFNLSGGTLDVNALNLSGAFNWTGGTLDIGEDVLTVDASSFVGSTLTMGASKGLIAGALQVTSGSTLEVTGGTVDLSSFLNVNDGSTYTQTAGLVSTPSFGSGSLNLNLDSFELGGGTLDISGSQARFWFGSDNNQTGGTFSNTAGDWYVGTFLGGNSFNLSGGLMEVNSLTVGSGATDNIFNLSGGTLDVNALSVSGAFNWTDGTLAPGVGTFSGNLTQPAAGTLSLELGGTTEGSGYDFIGVTGVSFLSGTLDVDVTDLGGGLFAPQAGDFFDLVRAETISGAFDTLLLPALAGGLTWEYATLIDAVGSTDLFRLQVVPEPSTVTLLALGLVALARCRRS